MYEQYIKENNSMIFYISYEFINNVIIYLFINNSVMH